MERFCARYTDWLILPNDSAGDVRIKRVLTPVALFLTIVGAAFLLQGLLEGSHILVAGSGAVIAGQLVIILAAVFRLRMGGPLDVFLVLTVVGALVFDFEAARELRARVWPLVLLLSDVGQWYDRPRTLPSLLGFALLYLLAERVE
eukprot:Hpha_TRINITY_DN753_c0_g1::TRINITY_DN753_c0_g1_i1::g.28945::m.28945